MTILNYGESKPVAHHNAIHFPQQKITKSLFDPKNVKIEIVKNFQREKTTTTTTPQNDDQNGLQ